MLPIVRPDATPADIRASIAQFEALLATHPEAVVGDSEQFPLTHYFGEGGTYVREIFIPAGSLLTGRIHKHAHPVVLLQGALRIVTEAGGVQEVRAPSVFVSPPGVKRAALALEDTRWLTFHVVSSQDLVAIEQELTSNDYAEYDAYRAALEAVRTPRELGEHASTSCGEEYA